MSGTGARYISPQQFASARLARGGGGVVILGASIENLSSFRTSTSENFGKDWPTYAMLLGGGRFNLIQNMAIGGQTTLDFIARFDTDVTPYRPNLVPMGSIENDIQLYGSQGLTNAQMMPLFRNSIHTLTAKCRAIGAIPVWRTAMPHVTPAVHVPTAMYNSWIRRYCSDEGLPCIDFWRVLVDPNTGQYKTWLAAPDMVHPNEEGAYQLASNWLQIMYPYLPPNYFQNPDGSDTGLLLPTPLFSTDTAGVPTGWVAAGGTPAGTARSMVTDTEGGYGRWLRHTHTASVASLSTQSGSTAIVPPTHNVGDVLEISGMISSDGGVTLNVVCSMITDGTSPSLNRVPISNITHSLERATYKQIMPPLPAGFLRYQVTLSSGTTGSQTGIADFSYPVVRNLTKDDAFIL